MCNQPRMIQKHLGGRVAKTTNHERRLHAGDGQGIWYSRGYFPHFDGENVTQHICFRLVDSLPQTLLEQWRQELQHLPVREADLERRKRQEAYLDQGWGACYLRQASVAEIVQAALLYFDRERYSLHAWCVMPNHVHTLVTPHVKQGLGTILHSWKSYTARECNRLLGRKGAFWAKESFDRYIRNERHFTNAIAYIENNPVKAGLCEQAEDWPWSSAGR